MVQWVLRDARDVGGRRCPDRRGGEGHLFLRSSVPTMMARGIASASANELSMHCERAIWGSDDAVVMVERSEAGLDRRWSQVASYGR